MVKQILHKIRQTKLLAGIEKRGTKMSVKVQIKKYMSGFRLNVQFSGKSRRIGILGASGSGKSMTLKKHCRD